MMTNEERVRRIKQRLADELAKADSGMWWLSFADASGFKGVVIVEAYGFTDALQRSHDAGINPGGEVQASRVDPSTIPEGLRNRLLSKADLAGFGVSSRKEA